MRLISPTSIFVMFLALANAQPSAQPLAPVLGRKHIIVLYDYSSSVLNEGSKVERANQYIDRLLFESGPLNAQSAEDLVQINSLGSESLFHDGDYLSFFAFGMPRTVLDEDLPRQDRRGFWSVFHANLVHPVAGPDSPLSAQEARTFLRQRLPSHGAQEHFYYTLSQYSLMALIAGLPERFAARTLVIHVSDLFSGENAIGTMDREMVRKRAPQMVSILDAAQRFQNDHFSSRSGLLQLSVGGYQGIKIQIFEVGPRDPVEIYFQHAGGAISEVSDGSWDLALPPLAASGVPPGHAAWFRSVEVSLALQLAGGQRIERRIPDIDALPLNSPRKLGTYHFTASELDRDQHQIAATIRWKLVYEPPGEFGMKLTLVRETNPLACAVASLPSAPPVWPWVFLALGLVATGGVVYYACFRRPGVVIKPAQPWIAGEDINGSTEPTRTIELKKYRRVIWGLEVLPCNWTIQLRALPTNLLRPKVFLRISTLKAPPALQQARLTLVVPGSPREAGFNEEIALGPLRPGQPVEFGLRLSLDGVAEPPAGELWTIWFGIAYRVGNGVEQILSDGFVIEENPGPLWLGVDPGTTGSCIAAGEDGNSLALIPLENEDPIMPSWVYVYEEDPPRPIADYIGRYRNLYYKTGSQAESMDQAAPERCFFSVKRLLGYKQSYALEVDGRTEHLAGLDLVGMLVRRMIDEAIRYRDAKNPAGKRPNKLVVAVPNMFTPAKIAQMKAACLFDPIARVDHIYEAEAVLMYYLGNLTKLARDRAASIQQSRDAGGELVIVLDFGGASLNLTYARITKQNQRTQIDVIQTIGYAFGGNDVDWRLGKFMANKLQDENSGIIKEFREFLSPPTSLRVNDKKWIGERHYFRDLCEGAKKVGTARWRTGQVGKSWNPLFPLPEAFSKWQTPHLSLTMEEVVGELDYQAIAQDGIRELCQLSKNTGLWKGVHTLLFSGRSTELPELKQSALEALTTEEEPLEHIDLSGPELKTCVAWGAAYSALQRNNIVLSRAKTMAYYGVIRQKSEDIGDREFIKLISPGEEFNAGTRHARERSVRDFGHNSGVIRFYQVTAANPDEVIALAGAGAYKRGELTAITYPKEESVTTIGVTIGDDDTLDAFVDCNGKLFRQRANFQIDDLLDGNGESATWLMPPPEN